MEEDLPNERERSAVEIYSKSLGTWIPGSVTAIVTDRDVVVHYSVAGARAGPRAHCMLTRKKKERWEGGGDRRGWGERARGLPLLGP